VKRLAAAPWLLRATFILLWTASAARADNWPQWRGPNYDGTCKETNLPSEWSDSKNVAWKMKMPGIAGSTPAIWGEHIFLTSVEGNDLVLICISTKGQELWKRKLGEGDRQFMRGEGNNASASPSTDGAHVYAFTGQGNFACYDFDGKEIWKFNAQERYGKFEIQHGMHITPLLYGDRLYLSLLHSGAWLVMAIDKNTGKDVWKIERDSDAKGECEQAYASPTLWHNEKEAYLIVHGNDYATAHSLKDGSEIWRVGDLNLKNRYVNSLRFVASPVAAEGLIVVPSAKNGPVVAIKPDARGLVNTGNASELWRRPRDTPDVPSPLVYEGLVYLCRENGVLICMDAKTGKELYQERLHNARYRASPVYADGKIYLTSRDGVISVVKAGPKFVLLAANRLPDQISASPAISNGRIYVRGWETLYAISAGGK
jgi:outer membrane protein assembly factor BamB